MKKKITYYILFCIWYLISLFPLRILYLISDGLFYLTYYIMRYRRPLVRKNLKESFPEKNKKKIIKIERSFYAWFCDYIVESIKLFSMSKKQIMKRMRFIGTEQINQSCRKGQSCAIFLGHYCNWEWVTSLPLWLDNDIVCEQIYHILENSTFDKLFLRLRNRFGATSIPMANTFKSIIQRQNEGKKLVVGFIADQVPLWNSIHYWTNFLHHDTPVFTGTERIAKHQNMSVYYLDIKRPKRGYYIAEFKLITNRPKQIPEFSITQNYIHLLETTIKNTPQFWLWSHNRWKRTHQEYNRIMGSIRTKGK